jgi:hypothetical protein
MVADSVKGGEKLDRCRPKDIVVVWNDLGRDAHYPVAFCLSCVDDKWCSGGLNLRDAPPFVRRAKAVFGGKRTFQGIASSPSSLRFVPGCICTTCLSLSMSEWAGRSDDVIVL